MYLSLVACKVIFTLNAVRPKRRRGIFTFSDGFAIPMNSRQMAASIISQTGILFATQRKLPNGSPAYEKGNKSDFRRMTSFGVNRNEVYIKACNQR